MANPPPPAVSSRTCSLEMAPRQSEPRCRSRENYPQSCAHRAASYVNLELIMNGRFSLHLRGFMNEKKDYNWPSVEECPELAGRGHSSAWPICLEWSLARLSNVSRFKAGSRGRPPRLSEIEPQILAIFSLLTTLYRQDQEEGGQQRRVFGGRSRNTLPLKYLNTGGTGEFYVGGKIEACSISLATTTMWLSRYTPAELRGPFRQN